MESAEWNTQPMVNKNALSHELIFRLREQFGPNGMLHSAGQMVPASPCPAGNTLFWRKDGYPVWKISASPPTKSTHQYTHNDAALLPPNWRGTCGKHLQCAARLRRHLFLFMDRRALPPTSIRCRPI